MNRLAALLRAPPEFTPVLQDAYAKMQAMANAGEAEAEYLVAWCRLYGLGVEIDEAAALPIVTAKAETGDPDAMFLAAVWAFKQKDMEQAAKLATRAAETGHGRSMMLLSDIERNLDNGENAAQWMKKAAEAGELAAIKEMISVAESRGKWEEMVFWVTVNMLCATDPAVAYRCRMIIAYVGGEADEVALLKVMEAGERWHAEHPVANRF